MERDLLKAAKEALELLKDKGFTGQIAKRLEQAIKTAEKTKAA